MKLSTLILWIFLLLSFISSVATAKDSKKPSRNNDEKCYCLQHEGEDEFTLHCYFGTDLIDTRLTCDPDEKNE